MYVHPVWLTWLKFQTWNTQFKNPINNDMYNMQPTPQMTSKHTYTPSLEKTQKGTPTYTTQPMKKAPHVLE